MVLMKKADMKNNIKQILNSAIKDHEEVLVSCPDGNLVIISQDDWEITKDTLKLLNDKIALRALLNGHAMRDKGEKPPGKSIDEVFDDLVD